MLRFFSVYLLKAWLPDVYIWRLYMTWPCVTSPTRDSDTYTTTSSHLILLRLWLHLSGCHAHISICVVKYLLTGASHDNELTVNWQWMLKLPHLLKHKQKTDSGKLYYLISGWLNVQRSVFLWSTMNGWVYPTSSTVTFSHFKHPKLKILNLKSLILGGPVALASSSLFFL